MKTEKPSEPRSMPAHYCDMIMEAAAGEIEIEADVGKKRKETKMKREDRRDVVRGHERKEGRRRKV